MKTEENSSGSRVRQTFLRLDIKIYDLGNENIIWFNQDEKFSL